MRRRELLVAIAGTAVWPLAARAQRQLRRIVVLTAVPPPSGAIEAFREGLRKRGYVDGESISIEVRWPQVSFAQEPDLVTAVAHGGADVIVAWPTPAAIAAQHATSTIPIVMVSVGDPVGTGLVASLARPGANVTGFSNQGTDVGAKQLELFIELVQGIKRVGLVHNPSNPVNILELREVRQAAEQRGLEAMVEGAATAAEYEAALSRLGQAGAQGVIFIPDPTTIAHRKTIAGTALARRLPTMFQRREDVEAGGLMSYGASLRAQFEEATEYVERILRGAKPADLPVMQPAKFELVVNRNTAKALGLPIPSVLLARADEVIE